MTVSSLPVYRLEETILREHQQFFEKHGFIHFRNFIDAGKLNSILQEVNNVQNYLIENNIDRVNGIPLKFGQDTDGSVRRIAGSTYEPKEKSVPVVRTIKTFHKKTSAT